MAVGEPQADGAPLKGISLSAASRALSKRVKAGSERNETRKMKTRIPTDQEKTIKTNRKNTQPDTNGRSGEAVSRSAKVGVKKFRSPARAAQHIGGQSDYQEHTRQILAAALSIFGGLVIAFETTTQATA